jgi:hypothetical protein
MDENKLNNISKKLFENIEFEKPPLDFTEKLMLKIEQAKSPQVVKSTSFFKNRFMLIFLLTFGLISLFGFLSSKNSPSTESTTIAEKYKLPTFDISLISKYLNINIDIGFIAKLIIGSIIILIVFDLISGTLIDRFIDSRARKENKV